MATPYRHRGKRPIKLSLLALALVIFPAASLYVRAQPAVNPKRVLVLYWDNKDFPGNVKFDENFKAQLASVARDTEYYPEYLETTRFPGENQSFFRDYLKQKYADRKIDVVVATADVPLRFLIQYRSDLFPDTPIVFAAVDPPSSENIMAGAGMTGIVIHQSAYRETVDLALKLHPDTNQIFVICGALDNNKRFESVARAELAPYENRVKITYLIDLSLTDLIARTSNLPPKSLVLYVWQQATDERGKLLETYEVLARIAPTTTAPIYSLGSNNLGLGIVGGFLQGPDNNGATAAEITGRILNGKRAQDIPVTMAPTVARFDDRQLRRWGINQSNLPSGSIIQFKNPTFWEEEKWYIIGALTAILVEAGLIAFLLITLRNVRSAKRETTRLTGVAESAHRRVGEIVSNVHGIVWESMIDPATNERRTTYISDYVEQMLGYTPAEWLAQPSGFGARLMHDDDREKALQESEKVVATGIDGFSQFRWRRKDGRFIWAANHLSPILNADGKVIGLRGVALDITDRKHAEETARLTEEKDRAILEAVPDLMFLHSPEGQYLDYHCKDVRDLFAPPEKFMGRNIRDILPQEVVQKLTTGFERLKGGSDLHLFEYRLPFNGSHKWFEARMVPSAGNVLTVVRDITARREAEESLRRAEAKDRAILEAIPDLMFLQTRDGVYLDHHCNHPEALLVSPDVFMGKNMRDVLPPDLVARFEAAFQRAIETRETQLIEYDLPLRGETRWFEARIVVSDENILSVIREITDRKLTEAALIESEDSYRSIFNAANDAIFVHELETGAIIDVNDRMCEMYECTAEEALTLGLSALSSNEPPYSEAEALELIRKAGAGTPQLFEWHAKKGTGELFWVEVSLRQLSLRGKECLLAVVRDITQRRLTAEAIKRSEAQLAGVIGSAMDGIITVDENQNIILFNESAERIFGWPAAEAIGQSLGQLMPSRYREQHRKHLQRFGAEHTGRRMMGERGIELFGVRHSGEEFPMEASISRIEVEGQNFYTVILRDITERKETENQLAESHRRITEVLESIADAFYSVDNDLNFTYVNRKSEELWAMRRQDLIGRNFLEVFPEATGTHSYHECMRALKEGRPVNFEAVSPILNRWVETSVYPTPAGLSIYFRDVTERKQAADALRESEARLRRAQEAARVGTWEWNIANGESVWSEMLWQLLGLRPGDGKATVERFLDFIHPEDRDRVWALANQVLEEGEDYHDEFRIVMEDGQILWFASKGRVIRSADGRPERMIGVNMDVTDRHRAHDELRESQERFVTAFRANPQPMSLTFLDTGEYVDVNDGFLQVSGYTREEVIGHTSLELNIWGSPQARAGFIKELQERGSLVNRETKLRAKDGSMRLLLSSAEQFEIDGRQCLLVASSDITERMLAQQALKESEQRFRNMADTAPVMIWIADTNRNSTYFNQQWLDFTGRTMAEEIGDGWTGGIHPLDLDGCLKMFEAAFDSREPFRMEYRLRRHDGAYRWVIDSGTPRFSAEGDFLGYIGSSVDITDRKESEAALVFAHEALENAYSEVNHLKTQLQEENIYLQEEIKLQHNFGEIVGDSDALKYVLFKIEQVAPTDSTVLITGETGTGKELVARAIHTASTRRDRPMVKVNCAALSASLIESELFGHEKGAFTGAMARKIGRFELADGATIFLDEIGELPLELQVKLLRIIQEGEFERLGSSKTVKLDVRIIAATNRNLREQVNKGLFREDLWYRLNVFPITVPPLRQRRDDIPMLIEHFAKTFASKLRKEINSVAPATINALRNYSWPGNVRELANVIERAVINSHGPLLRVHEQLRPANGDAANGDPANSVGRTLEEVERDYVIRVLEDRGWRIEGPHGAAHVLGLNPSTLRTRMAKLGISKANQNAAANGNS